MIRILGPRRRQLSAKFSRTSSMSRSPAISWLEGAIIGAVAVAASIEFFHQRDQLRDWSLAAVATLPVLIRAGLLGISVSLLRRGWPRRRGLGLHCRHCGYRQEDRGEIISLCPECGSPWRWIGSSRTGERIGEPWMLGVAALLFVMVAGTWLVRRAAPSLMLSWLPDDVLLQQVAAFPDDEVFDQWAELDQRIIPAHKLDTLAESLMRKKFRDGYLSHRAELVVMNWLSRTPLPPPAARQYFAQVLSAEMRAPEKVETGEPVRIRTGAIFKGDTLAAGGQTGPPIVIASALYFGDETKPVQSWVWPVRAIPGDQFRQMDHAFTPAAPGTVEPHQVFWLLIGGDGTEVTMSDSGPILPKGMQVYSQFEVTTAIEVIPPRPPAR